jgi:chromosome segregation ATPase
MNPPYQPCQATPAGDLRQQILDSRVPKNEREWWASRTIEKLERELTETERQRFGADAERRRLRAELASKTACYDIACSEVQRLRAEVERLNAQVELDDKAKLFLVRLNRSDRIRAEKAEAEVERLTAKIANQADRIRYLEGATNHATGTPLSQAIALTEKAEDIIRSLRRISNIPIGSDAATNPAIKGTP